MPTPVSISCSLAIRFPILCLLFFSSWASQSAIAKSGIVITEAKWSQPTLTVTGKLKDSTATAVDLYDSSGRPLGQATVDGDRRFSFSKADLERPELLCSVRAKTGDASATMVVKGRDKTCAKVPVCKILNPIGSLQVPFDTDVSFKARASLKDPVAKPLRLEWDFAGGTMGEAQKSTAEPRYRKANRVTAKVRFIRDNTRYRVRFTAWDNKQRYCEDSVEVTVGNPPDAATDFQATLSSVQALAQASSDSAPTPGSQLGGLLDETVVLPFEDLTMQSLTDARLATGLYATIWPYFSMNAVAYRKDRIPERLTSDRLSLSYAAASNPADPVGPNSINATSQNWPAGTPLLDATLQKSDLFEPAKPLNADLNAIGHSFTGDTLPDEGFKFLPNPPSQLDHGSYMPGIATPYQANDAQPFSLFNSERTWFSAYLLPLSDIDDQGRINPYLLQRVTGTPTDNPQATTATDAVLTASRDLHCRECHEKGGIAANPETPFDMPFNGVDLKPTFYEAQSARLDDRELAAQINIASLHDYYNGMGIVAPVLGGDPHAHHGGGTGPLEYGVGRCSGCHSQFQSGFLSGFIGNQARKSYGTANNGGPGSPSEVYEGGRSGIIGMDDSAAIHLLHGQLSYDNSKSTIRRWPTGRFQRWHPEDGPNPAPLFPVKSAKGKLLPSEDNCLKCHGGEREQSYRDRMYSAGVTCYQCHGDMLAVGGFYRLGQPGADGRDRRLPWLDEPDCGACHTGSANTAATGKKGYYSPGVRTLAFDDTDPSAQPRKPSDGPDGIRFAVPVTTAITSNYAVSEAVQTAEGVDMDYNDGRFFGSASATSYRLGKDSHGDVPCAACHGAAHAIWPNRNPNANDNVTALQLQGHTGPLLECNTCHTADSFAKKADLDGRLAMNVPDGVLGGPHNLHPVNDPFWWKEAAGDATNDSGTTKGGWHNDYAKTEGAAGEDQCAACHGNDHKGTRLSRTPVAREFVDEKGETVKVKAGGIIGCNLCHTIAKSCTKSPNPNCGTSRGHTETTNRPPVFTSVPVKEMIRGQTYHYTATATDPDGDPVEITVSHNPSPPDSPDAEARGKMEFDAATASVTADWATMPSMPLPIQNYTLQASDGRGGITNQHVSVSVACAAGLLLEGTECIKLKVSSQQSMFGVEAGKPYRYQIIAEQGDHRPLTFTLAEGAPAGMTVTSQGVIDWDTSGITDESDFFATITVNDDQGNSLDANVSVHICTGSQHWNGLLFRCMGPIWITSPAPLNGYGGLAVGEQLVHHATATHKQNLPLQYSLRDAPAGMAIDAASGHLEWTAGAESVGSYNITIDVTDNQGGFISQPFTLTVCPQPQHWSNDDFACLD